MQSFAPTINYFSQFGEWGNPWTSALDILNGSNIFLDPSSSQPKGFVSRIYDGNLGSLNDPTGSYLIFDDNKAAIRVLVPDWRVINSVDLYALESVEKTKAKVKLYFINLNGRRETLNFTRKVKAIKNGLAQVEYKSWPNNLGKTNGEFLILYDNTDFSSAFISEIIINGLGVSSKIPPNKLQKNKLMCSDGNGLTCSKINLDSLRISDVDISLTSLEFWRIKKIQNKNPYNIHSFIIKTDNVGDQYRDITPAWLFYPIDAKTKAINIPLVVIVGDTSEINSSLELMGFIGRPEFAIAPDLVKAGFGVLIVNLPESITTIAQHKKIKMVLNQVLKDSVKRSLSLGLNSDKIGIWGYGNGATLAILAASVDERYSAIGLSRPKFNINSNVDQICNNPSASDFIDIELIDSLANKNIISWGDIDLSSGCWRWVSKYNNIELHKESYSVLSQKEKNRLIDFMWEQLGN
jgi:hypothetical protein